jgi:uridylate kinase
MSYRAAKQTGGREFESLPAHMKIVIKIGGSLTFDEKGPCVEYIKKLVDVIKEIKTNNLVIVVGGGKIVRSYIKALKEFGLKNEEIEWVAIDLLKANVRLFSFLTGLPALYSLEELKTKQKGILGGIFPGRSTDANAALAAELINADMLIKMTDVDGIYTKDPKIFKDAKKMEKISFDEIEKYAVEGSPGAYGILDKLAIEVIKRSKIKTFVINGKEPENLLYLLNGEKIGTEISS